MNRHLAGTLLFFVLLLPLSAAAQPLTLDQAIDAALQRNERIRQYQERVRQREYQHAESWGNFLPGIQFTGSRTHLDDPIVIDLDPIRQALIAVQSGNQTEFANAYRQMAGLPALTAAQRQALTAGNAAALASAIPRLEETVKQQNYSSAAFTATQPLFVGGKLIAAERAAAAEERFAGCELEKVRDEVIQETVNGYVNVVLLQDIVRTRRAVLDGMQRHERQARRLQEEGMIAAHQVLRAEVAVAEAERNLFDDTNRLALARLALCTTLGITDDGSLLIADSLVMHECGDSLGASERSALTGQPVLQMLAEKRIAAGQKYNADRAEFLPQAAAFARYEVYPQYLSMLEPRWAAGIQISLPIFTGLKRYERLQASAHLEREVEYAQADAARRITLLVHKCHGDMRNARNRYGKLETNIRLARENLRLMQQRFETGLGNSLDVIDARLILEKNQVEQALTLSDYYHAMTDLFAAQGTPERVAGIWNSKEQIDDHH